MTILRYMLPYTTATNGVVLSYGQFENTVGAFISMLNSEYRPSKAFNDLNLIYNQYESDLIDALNPKRLVRDTLVRYRILKESGNDYTFEHPLLGETLSAIHLANQIKVRIHETHPILISSKNVLAEHLLNSDEISLLSNVLREHDIDGRRGGYMKRVPLGSSVLREYMKLFSYSEKSANQNLTKNYASILEYAKRKLDKKKQGLSEESFLGLDFRKCASMGYNVFNSTFKSCVINSGFFSQTTSFYEIAAVKFVGKGDDEDKYIAVLTHPGEFIIYDRYTMAVCYKEILISSEARHQGNYGFEFVDLSVVYDNENNLVLIAIDTSQVMVFDSSMNKMYDCSVFQLKEHLRDQFYSRYNNSHSYEEECIWEKILGDEVTEVRKEMTHPRHRILTANHLVLADYSSKSLFIWSLSQERKPINALKIDATGSINGIDITTDEKIVITGCQDGSVRLWDTKYGNQLNEIKENSDIECAVIIDEHRLAVGLDTGWIKIWNIDKGVVIAEKWAHQDEMVCLCYDEERHALISGGIDGTVHIWDIQNDDFDKEKQAYIATQKQPKWRQTIIGYEEKPYNDSVLNLVVAGKNIVSIGYHNWYVWGENERNGRIALSSMNRLSTISCNGNLIAFVEKNTDEFVKDTDNCNLCVYNIATDEKIVLCTIRCYESKVAMAFSNNDEFLAINIEGNLKVYNFTEKEIRDIHFKELKLHDDRFDNPADEIMRHFLDSLRFSHDGSKLIYCDYEGVIRIFDVNNNFAMLNNGIFIHPCVVYANLTPNGKRLVAVNSDVIAIYDLNNNTVRLVVNLNNSMRNNSFINLKSDDISVGMLEVIRQNGNKIDKDSFDNIETVSESGGDKKIGYDRSFVMTRILDYAETISRYTCNNDLPLAEVKRIDRFFRPLLDTRYAHKSTLPAVYHDLLYALKKSGESYAEVTDKMFDVAYKFHFIEYDNSKDFCVTTITRNLSSWSKDADDTPEQCSELLVQAERILDAFWNDGRISDEAADIICGAIYQVISKGKTKVFYVLNDHNEDNAESNKEALNTWRNIFEQAIEIIRFFYESGNDGILIVGTYTNTLNELMRLVESKKEKLDILDELYFVYRDNKLTQNMAYNFARSCDHFAYDSIFNQNFNDLKLVLQYLEEVNLDFPGLPDVIFVMVVYNIALVGQKGLAMLHNPQAFIPPESIEQMETMVESTLDNYMEFSYTAKLFKDLKHAKHHPISCWTDEHWTKTIMRFFHLLLNYGYFGSTDF